MSTFPIHPISIDIISDCLWQLCVHSLTNYTAAEPLNKTYHFLCYFSKYTSRDSCHDNEKYVNF
jgi:hypothetical protein